jgi:hypothetical protein
LGVTKVQISSRHTSEIKENFANVLHQDLSDGGNNREASDYLGAGKQAEPKAPHGEGKSRKERKLIPHEGRILMKFVPRQSPGAVVTVRSRG